MEGGASTEGRWCVVGPCCTLLRWGALEAEQVGGEMRRCVLMF